VDSVSVQGVRVPGLMYGTAWKEERTEALVRQALAEGFRAIDTANQRKHYFEAGVGAALVGSGVPRDALFVQTKFTYQRGQDHRLPYDARATLALQLQQSFESSLEHLGLLVIDSYVLHGPWASSGWTRQDREVWGAMQALQQEGRVRMLGISNVSLEQLAELCDGEAAAPAFVQNRCYARDGWDRQVRAFCKQHGIVYQAFSLLTANRRELAGSAVRSIAQRLRATVPQVVFAFAAALEMLPLTGTTDPQHMRQDLASSALALSAAEVDTLLHIASAAS
jgi:diketogulonate reductase-like aldo/keto reductase